MKHVRDDGQERTLSLNDMTIAGARAAKDAALLDATWVCRAEINRAVERFDRFAYFRIRDLPGVVAVLAKEVIQAGAMLAVMIDMAWTDYDKALDEEGL